MRKLYTEENEPPFCVGQNVVGIAAPEGSRIKNGQLYAISDCHYSYCKNSKRHYWYVGVEGCGNKWLWPGLFTAIDSFKAVTFEKISEENPVSTN